MKKVLVLLAIALFVTSSAFAFTLPSNRADLPDSAGYKLLGQKNVNQKLEPGGKGTMKGYQKGKTQMIQLYFEGETRPYCYWLADVDSRKSQGRCDIDNNGSYEYDFDATGRTGRSLYFKPAWPTAED